MSALHTADQMMTIANDELEVAMWILPPAVMIKYQFTLSKGVPENIDKAGQQWRQVSQKLQQTSSDLQEAIASVSPDSWSGDDRKAYEQQVKQLCQQLEIAAQYYMAVGVALTAFAYALFAYAVFAVAMGTTVGALAAGSAAAMAGVVTAELVPEFEEAAGVCLEVTIAATAILAGAGAMAAEVFQGGALLAAEDESAHGDKQALSDFGKAEVRGASAAVANLGQNAINAGLDFANRTGGEDLPGMGKGEGKGLPISSVDLDADRDKDGNTQLGVGVEGDKGGGALHGTYGAHGLQSVEASGHGKAGDHDISGKVGYKDDQGVFSGKHGVISGELGDTVTSGDGSKNQVTAGGSYDTHDHAGSGNVNYTHTGVDGSQDTAKVSGGYNASTHQATGGVSYSHTSATGSVNQVGADGGYNTSTHQATGSASYSHEGLSGAQSSGRVDGGYNTSSHQATGSASYTHHGLTGSENTGTVKGGYNTGSGDWSGEGSVSHDGSTVGRAGYDSMGNSFYADDGE